MNKITKLAIFDFDGTLVDTPLPDTGKDVYKEKTGKEWPHQGWWGKYESLDLEVFEIPTIESVISDYERELADDTTAVIMLTGRMIKLSDHVKIILDTKGLKFDEYHFNKGGRTELAKIQSMNGLLNKYPEVTNVEMWDDRLEHIPVFEQWGKEHIEDGRLTHFKINVVPSGHHDPINND